MRIPFFKSGFRGVLRDALVVAVLIFFTPTTWMFCLGLCVFISGAGLHFWSKGCLARNDEVTQSGPYRFVRHPFYLANALLDLGICTMSGRPAMVALYPLLFWVSYVPVLRREEQYLTGAFPEAYRAYATQVPTLIPYRFPSASGGDGFLWRNIVRENEIARLLRLLAIPCYFSIVALGFHGVLPSGPLKTGVLSGAIGCALFLNVVSAFAKHRRKRLILFHYAAAMDQDVG